MFASGRDAGQKPSNMSNDIFISPSKKTTELLWTPIHTSKSIIPDEELLGHSSFQNSDFPWLSTIQNE